MNKLTAPPDKPTLTETLSRWLLTVRNPPASLHERQEAQLYLLYTFVTVIINTFNVILVEFIGGYNFLNILFLILTVASYGFTRFFYHKQVIVASVLCGIGIAYFYLLGTGSPLETLAFVFTVTIGLHVASQFLSLRTNLQISILTLILTLVVLSQVQAFSFSVLTMIVPLLTVILLTILNAYRREQIKKLVEDTAIYQKVPFYQYALDIIPKAAVMTMGDDQRIVAANKAAHLLFNRDDSVIGQPLATYLDESHADNHQLDHQSSEMILRYDAQLQATDQNQPVVVNVVARLVPHEQQLAKVLILRSDSNASVPELPTPTTAHDTQLLQTVATSISDYAYVLERNDQNELIIRWVSPSVQQFFDLNEHVAQMAPYLTRIYPDDRTRLRAYLSNLRAGESAYIDYRIMNKDHNDIRWMRDRSLPIGDATSQQVQRVIGMVHDISQQVQTQETLKQMIHYQAVAAELNLMALSDSNNQTLFDYITSTCHEMLTISDCTIFRYEPTTAALVCVSRAGEQSHFEIGTHLSLEAHSSLEAYSFQQREAIIVESMAEEARFQLAAQRHGNNDQSGMALVIKGHQQAYGVLSIYRENYGRFHHDEFYFVQSLIDIIGTFIERNRALTLQKQQREFSDALRDATLMINARLELDEILSKIVSYVQHVIPHTDRIALLLQAEDPNIYTYELTWRFPESYSQYLKTIRVNASETPIMLALIQSRQTLLIHDVRQDARWTWAKRSQSNTVSALIAPIVIADNCIGFIVISSPEQAAFDKTDSQRLKSFADKIGTAIINARKHEELEQLVAQRTRELKREREQLEAIFSGTGDGIIYSEDGYVMYVNQAFCDLTAYTADGLIGKHVRTLMPSSEGRQGLRSLIESIMTLTSGEVWRDDVTMTRATGESFNASLAVSRISAADEAVVRVVTVVRDNGQQAQLDEFKKRFIATAAHELRSPISSLKTRMYLMKRDPSELDHHIERLESSIERLNYLVSTLLDVASFERGRISLQRKHLILQSVIQDVIEILAPRATEARLKLVYDISDTPIPIFGDHYRLEQVLVNLIGNAIHYTEADGQIMVRCFALAPSQQACITIEDNGSGIPDEELPYIFQPFYRAKHNTKKGSGLGLSITKEIVDLHEGMIAVQSEFGVGTTFTIHLPALPAAE